MNEIFIRGLQMPATSRGVVVEIEDDFIVFINTELCPECQRRTIIHEIEHIKRDHFYKDDLVVADEREANNNM